MPKRGYNDNVFINCPFDKQYQGIFKAMIFTIFDCGFRARCSLEEEDASQVRIDKIFSLIENCRHGIHDISRTSPDKKTRLPRFNMPLELGIFLGIKKSGSSKQRNKKSLILDTSKHRYNKFISDIKGQDIKEHKGQIKPSVKAVRNWLRIVTGRKDMPGWQEIWNRYLLFTRDLPKICKKLKLIRKDLLFNEYTQLVCEWLDKNS